MHMILHLDGENIGAHEVQIALVFASARCGLSVQMMCNMYMFVQVMYERSETWIE